MGCFCYALMKALIKMSIEEEGGNFNFFTISILKYKVKKIISYKLS